MNLQAIKSKFPTGNVTLFFSDIEGSSENWEKYGNSFSPVLSKHNSILRAAAAKWNGYEVKTEGDSFFIAFELASNAISFAVEAQKEICAFDWTSVHAQVKNLKIRIGIHTGEALVVSESERAVDYFGSSVNRAARVCGCGHGGQILISQATYTIAYKDPNTDISYLDLGEYELKGIGPERLYQVCHSNLEKNFPPVRAGRVARNNIPTQLTRFLGREEEVAWTLEAITRNRLVTLTGTGGIGKTRLSLVVAERALPSFPDGVYFIELAAVTNYDDVIPAIADALNIQEISSRSVMEALEDYLNNKSILLILDNFEHVLQAADQIGHLLMKSPGLKLLVTSRSVLNIHGESQYAVPPLSLPNLDELTLDTSVEQYSALSLFIESAKRVKPDFKVGTRETILMVKICERLEGLPLAIELAASKVKMISLEAILSRLDKRFDLLTGGPKTAPDRHKTLRAAIDSSFELLDKDERNLLMILSVFVGGFSLDMAEEICRADSDVSVGVMEGISSLCDKSLIRPMPNSGSGERFKILETIRQYCIEKAVDELRYENFQARHAVVYGRYVNELGKYSLSGRQMETFESLESDIGNIRAAMDWAVQVRDVAVCGAFIEDLWSFWVIRGRLDEASKYFQIFLQLSSVDVLSRDFPKSVIGGAIISYYRGDGESAIGLALNALPFCVAKNEPWYEALALLLIGCVEVFVGKYAEAVERWTKAVEICRGLKEIWTQSICESMIGYVALLQGDVSMAHKCCYDSFAKARETNELYCINQSLCNLAILAEAEGDIEQSRLFLREGLVICQQLQYVLGLSLNLVGLARIAFRRGDYKRAVTILMANDWLKEEYRIEMPPAYLVFYKVFRDETLEASRKQMSQAMLEDLTEAVREMELEEIVEFVLHDESSPQSSVNA